MSQDNRLIVWVGAQILPHEAAVRGWLGRARIPPDQADDVVQEAYCRIAALTQVDHIRDGRAYLFQTVRNILREQFRRARVVKIEALTDFELSIIPDNGPSPERIVAGQRELQRLEALIANLPSSCKEVLRLRKVLGLSQKETARRLGVTENVVEAQTARGLRLVLASLSDAGELSDPTLGGGRRVETGEAPSARRVRD